MPSTRTLRLSPPCTTRLFFLLTFVSLSHALTQHHDLLPEHEQRTRRAVVLQQGNSFAANAVSLKDANSYDKGINEKLSSLVPCKPASVRKLERKMGKLAKTLKKIASTCTDSNSCTGANQDFMTKPKDGGECLCPSEGGWSYDENRFPPYIYTVACLTKFCAGGELCSPRTVNVWVLRRRRKMCRSSHQKERWVWMRELISTACSCRSLNAT